MKTFAFLDVHVIQNVPLAVHARAGVEASLHRTNVKQSGEMQTRPVPTIAELNETTVSAIATTVHVRTNATDSTWRSVVITVHVIRTVQMDVHVHHKMIWEIRTVHPTFQTQMNSVWKMEATVTFPSNVGISVPIWHTFVSPNVMATQTVKQSAGQTISTALTNVHAIPNVPMDVRVPTGVEIQRTQVELKNAELCGATKQKSASKTVKKSEMSVFRDAMEMLCAKTSVTINI